MRLDLDYPRVTDDADDRPMRGHQEHHRALSINDIMYQPYYHTLIMSNYSDHRTEPTPMDMPDCLNYWHAVLSSSQPSATASNNPVVRQSINEFHALGVTWPLACPCYLLRTCTSRRRHAGRAASRSRPRQQPYTFTAMPHRHSRADAGDYGTKGAGSTQTCSIPTTDCEGKR